MSASAPAGYRRVASLSDLPPNTLLSVPIEDQDYNVCLAHADGRIYAFRDNCTHKDFPLSAGTLEGGQIECTWHGARFDVASGRAVRLPAIKPVRTFEVKVEDGDIYIAV